MIALMASSPFRQPILFLLAAAPLFAQLSPTDLRVEYLANPLGVDTPSPRFSWVPREAERGARPIAYQIIVTGADGTAWDSGKVASEETGQIAYAGKALESGKSYAWRVRWWDQADRVSPYASGHFDTGLFSSSDWSAKWIRGANQLRREFTLASKPVRARAYVAGVGYYELRINGRKVGDRLLDSPYTPYDKRILYSTYDVTDMLDSGTNAVGVMLGQGWFASRAAIVQIEVEFAGGKRASMVTDATWKGTQGPILADSIYDGEVYDARREMRGWDRAGFDDSRWEPVSLNDPPKGVLSSEMMPPIRAVGEIMPVKMDQSEAGHVGVRLRPEFQRMDAAESSRSGGHRGQNASR